MREKRPHYKTRSTPHGELTRRGIFLAESVGPDEEPIGGVGLALGSEMGLTDDARSSSESQLHDCAALSPKT